MSMLTKDVFRSGNEVESLMIGCGAHFLVVVLMLLFADWECLNFAPV